MARIKEHATEIEAFEVQKKLITLKSKIGCTYIELANILGTPCTGGTLQHRVRYPRKPMSKELYLKIIKSFADHEAMEMESEQDLIFIAFEKAVSNINRVALEELDKLRKIVIEVQQRH